VIDAEALQLPIKELKHLSEYLADHEEDIAWGFNDFEELRDIFHLIYGRSPMKDRNDMPEMQ